MKYGIVGLGPVGAFFAASLKQQGHEVTVLCRNEHQAKNFLENPIEIEGEFQAKAQLTEIYSDIIDFSASNPDVIFICTKGHYSTSIIRQFKHLGLKDNVSFVSCQNGINVEEQISEIYGDSKTMRMILNFGCNFVTPNKVWVSFNFEHFLSSKKSTHPVDEVVYKDLLASGLSIKHVENYKEEAFKKAILNSALSSICALTRMTMKQVMAEQVLVKMVRELLREAISVGTAMGYDVDDFLETAVSYLSKGGDHKPSMLVDIEKARVSENEYHCGQLFRYAQDLNVDVPVIQTIYYLIKNLEKAVVSGGYVAEGMKELNHV